METSELTKDLYELRQEFGFVRSVPCTPEETEKFTADRLAGRALPPDICCEVNATTSLSLETTDGEAPNEAGGNTITKYSFRRLVPSDVPYEEEMEYLSLFQAKNLKTIKNCTVFFTAITAVALVAWLINLIIALT